MFVCCFTKLLARSACCKRGHDNKADNLFDGGRKRREGDREIGRDGEMEGKRWRERDERKERITNVIYQKVYIYARHPNNYPITQIPLPSAPPLEKSSNILKR